MNEHIAVKHLVERVKDYAAERGQNVARGAETPRLAALLLQKYGLGIAMAVAVAFESERACDPIMKTLDEETMKLDPEWREHDRERWAGRPADVVAHT